VQIHLTAVAKFLVPDWGNKVNPMPVSTIFPSQELVFAYWLIHSFGVFIDKKLFLTSLCQKVTVILMMQNLTEYFKLILSRETVH
jgi:hypothetical protein